MPKEHLRGLQFRFFRILLAGAFIVGLWVHTPMAQNQQTSLVTAIETVARQAVPAVVHIEVTERQTIPNPLLPFEKEPFFKYFFGNRRCPKISSARFQDWEAG